MKNGFHYYRNRLYVDEIPLETLTAEYGTPLYVYSQSRMLENLNAFHTAFKTIPHLICYALKANSNLGILRVLAENGAGADIVSGGELERAVRAGIPTSRIVFAGVGKTEAEISAALKRRVLMINVESIAELEVVSHISGQMRRTAPIALRVNPDIDPRTHPYISTGLQDHKFGIPFEEAFHYYAAAAKLKQLKVCGIHMHLGSQILSVSPYRDGFKKLLTLVDSLKDAGIQIQFVDIGGGLGIDYQKEGNLAPHKISDAIRPLIGKRRLTLILEPGRSIIADAGVLISKVLYIKRNRKKRFAILDAGMNDFLRPALYDAFHRIQPLRQTKRKTGKIDLVGPVCETGDFFAMNREIPELKAGEFVAIMEAGAYGSSMSSNYNSRLRPAEVLVDGKTHRLIRRRETLKDLIRQEEVFL